MVLSAVARVYRWLPSTPHLPVQVVEGGVCATRGPSPSKVPCGWVSFRAFPQAAWLPFPAGFLAGLRFRSTSVHPEVLHPGHSSLSSDRFHPQLASCLSG